MKQLKVALIGFALFFSTFSFAEQQTQWLDKVDLAQYQNNVIYLDFWASWCGPCRKSFPWLNEMQEKYKDQGLVIIGINLDREISSANSFLSNTPANFLLYSDPSGELGEQYKLVGMPSSYLVNAKGEVQVKHIGFKKSETSEYEANIVELLAQLPKNKE